MTPIGYVTLGLSAGVYLGHRVTTWLWQHKVRQLKLDWIEEAITPKRSAVTMPIPARCVCGHMAADHVMRNGICGSVIGAGGLCRCEKFNDARKNTQ